MGAKAVLATSCEGLTYVVTDCFAERWQRPSFSLFFPDGDFFRLSLFLSRLFFFVPYLRVWEVKAEVKELFSHRHLPSVPLHIRRLQALTLLSPGRLRCLSLDIFKAGAQAPSVTENSETSQREQKKNPNVFSIDNHHLPFQVEQQAKPQHVH